MADDQVAQHWPHLAELAALVDALDGRTVTVQAQQTPAVSGRSYTDAEIDAIHDALLKKQRRNGSLGLNK